MDVEPLLDPSDLSSTTSTYEGLSDTTFEGIDDGIGDDDGTQDVIKGAFDGIGDDDGTNGAVEGMFEFSVSMEKLRSRNRRSCPNHSDKSLHDTRKDE